MLNEIGIGLFADRGLAAFESRSMPEVPSKLAAKRGARTRCGVMTENVLNRTVMPSYQIIAVLTSRRDKGRSTMALMGDDP
jgi:hypothetical protein